VRFLLLCKPEQRWCRIIVKRWFASSHANHRARHDITRHTIQWHKIRRATVHRKLVAQAFNKRHRAIALAAHTVLAVNGIRKAIILLAPKSRAISINHNAAVLRNRQAAAGCIPIMQRYHPALQTEGRHDKVTVQLESPRMHHLPVLRSKERGCARGGHPEAHGHELHLERTALAVLTAVVHPRGASVAV